MTRIPVHKAILYSLRDSVADIGVRHPLLIPKVIECFSLYGVVMMALASSQNRVIRGIAIPPALLAFPVTRHYQTNRS